MTPPTIILLGLRGSGKTTLGRALAQKLSREFVDLDDEVARSNGSESSGEALRSLGEARFRRAEASALFNVLAHAPRARGKGRILALGGGTPTNIAARQFLEDLVEDGRAQIVYLRATPATLRERLRATDLAERPSLTGEGTLEEIDQLFAARDNAYRALATRTLDVDGMDEGSACQRLCELAKRADAGG